MSKMRIMGLSTNLGLGVLSLSLVSIPAHAWWNQVCPPGYGMQRGTMSPLPPPPSSAPVPPTAVRCVRPPAPAGATGLLPCPPGFDPGVDNGPPWNSNADMCVAAYVLPIPRSCPTGTTYQVRQRTDRCATPARGADVKPPALNFIPGSYPGTVTPPPGY
jgi:hypothetical protein